MLQGVLHLHSTYSDGEFSLPELRDLFTAEGLCFACVTDHADAFEGDDRRLERYAHDCESLSDASFRFIAGLEYTCVNRMHILGYGVVESIDSMDPAQVISRIQARGGLAVIAHPNDEAFAAIERFDPLPDGIEVWNSKYDGRYAPRPGTFELLARTKVRRPDVRAFYGQDLHWRRQYRGLIVEVNAPVPDCDAILAALAAGSFSGVRDGQRLPSDGVLPSELLDRFARAHRRSQAMRRWLRGVKSWGDQIGLAVPRPIKAQLRRIF